MISSVYLWFWVGPLHYCALWSCVTLCKPCKKTLAPTVLLQDHWPMITIPFHPNPHWTSEWAYEAPYDTRTTFNELSWTENRKTIRHKDRKTERHARLKAVLLQKNCPSFYKNWHVRKKIGHTACNTCFFNSHQANCSHSITNHWSYGVIMNQ